MVPRGGIEPPTLRFSVVIWVRLIGCIHSDFGEREFISKGSARAKMYSPIFMIETEATAHPAAESAINCEFASNRAPKHGVPNMLIRLRKSR